MEKEKKNNAKDWMRYVELCDPVNVSSIILNEPMVSVLIQVHIPVRSHFLGQSDKSRPAVEGSSVLVLNSAQNHGHTKAYLPVLVCMPWKRWEQHVERLGCEGDYQQGWQNMFAQRHQVGGEHSWEDQMFNDIQVRCEYIDESFYEHPVQKEYLNRLHRCLDPYVRWFYQKGESVQQLQQYISNYNHVYQELSNQSEKSMLLMDRCVRGAGDPQVRLGTVWNIDEMLTWDWTKLGPRTLEKQKICPVLRLADVYLEWSQEQLEQWEQQMQKCSKALTPMAQREQLKKQSVQLEKVFEHIEEQIVQALAVGTSGVCVLMNSGASYWAKMVLRRLEAQRIQDAQHLSSALENYQIERVCASAPVRRHAQL